MNARSRYSVLDLVRGLTLISMIAYHGTYDLVYLFSIKIPPTTFIVAQSIPYLKTKYF